MSPKRAGKQRFGALLRQATSCLYRSKKAGIPSLSLILLQTQTKNMMKRADVRIRGNVQMAGFRTFIKNTADSLNVKGFAENLEDGSVRVVCEGEEDAIVLKGREWL